MSSTAVRRSPFVALFGALVGVAASSALALASCRAARAGEARAPASSTATESAALSASDAANSSANSSAVREAALPRRRASGRVTVRLSAPANATLELTDASGARRRARRVGREVALDEQPLRDTVELAAGDGRTLAIGASSYRGSLRLSVEPSGEWRVENLVEFEDYVLGVVARELGFGDRPREAWRAQAIAARSYALANLEQRGAARPDPYLFDGVRDQAYAGEPSPANARERNSLERLREALASTAGLVLIENGECVDARYHSSCGGRTADGRAVFPELRSQCLVSVTCEPCASSSAVQWNWTARRDELNSVARAYALGDELVSLAPLERDASQRWLTVELVGNQSKRSLRFEELRRALGRDKLRSARVLGLWPKPGEPLSTGLAFRGAGFGHGAGLCQQGALEYARMGWSAEQILAHYFRGARIEDRR